MQKQGSIVIPSLRYRDGHAGIEWLKKALGFEAQAVFKGPDNTVAHAQLVLGTGMVMLGSAGAGEFSQHSIQPDETGGRVTHGVYLVLADTEGAYQRAVTAGAKIIMDLRTMEYGGKAFTCADPEGYLWSVGEYDPWAPA